MISQTECAGCLVPVLNTLSTVETATEAHSGILVSQIRQMNWSQVLPDDIRVPSTSTTAVKIARKDAHMSMML